MSRQTQSISVSPPERCGWWGWLRDLTDWKLPVWLRPVGLDAYDRTNPEPQNYIQLTTARTQTFHCITLGHVLNLGFVYTQIRIHYIYI